MKNDAKKMERLFRCTIKLQDRKENIIANNEEEAKEKIDKLYRSFGIKEIVCDEQGLVE